MRFLRKSIIRKLFLNLFLFAVLIGVIAFYFFHTDQGVLPFEYFLAGLGIFLVYFLVAYWIDIIRPLKKVLNEMQAVLAGKPYKNIYTDRIDEIGVLAHFFNQVTAGFGEVSRDIQDRDRMMSELDVAAQLQRDILPLESPLTDGLQIVAKTKPATELGGDSFNFIKVKDRTFMYIGDVTGHGVAAGLIMTMVNSLISVFAEMYDSGYEILVNVNKFIKRHVKKAMFMTLVMLVWDEKLKTLRYVGAGHEHILVYRADSGECEAILSGGVALGMIPDNSKIISEKEVVLNDGDFVVLYSDGITEARGANGELFGLDRLKDAVKEFASQYSAEGVNYHIAQTVTNFMQSQDDDMTLIVMKRDDKWNRGSKAQDQTTNWKD